jgi:ATP-dependent exoDNAse (exonuclease V) alpha subunit
MLIFTTLAITSFSRQDRLKIGCPIILLRNIDKRRGLCNGTRATITHMTDCLLQIRVVSGDHIGETALIPRITLSPSPTDLDFSIKLNRRQFPVQLAFAMTINKAQGQTVKRVGIDLRKPVFSHGQLYIAFSRATSPGHITVLLPRDTPESNTPNVIYPEVLLE